MVIYFKPKHLTTSAASNQRDCLTKGNFPCVQCYFGVFITYFLILSFCVIYIHRFCIINI